MSTTSFTRLMAVPLVLATFACGKVSAPIVDAVGADGGDGTFVVQVVVVGGPGGTVVTPSSSTPGATCDLSSCRVPAGGSVSATAPSVPDWFFAGWTGAVAQPAAVVSITNVSANLTVSAGYINQRSEACRDDAPPNATTASTAPVMTTYTTAGGWSTPAACPWACNPDFCQSGATCAPAFLDQIGFTIESASGWFGGDSRVGLSRSVGAGQSVTPPTTVAMDRFGFRYQSGFTSAVNGQPTTAPVTLELDRRNSNGAIVTRYTTVVPIGFTGGWVYWDMPTTTLAAGQQHIFTAWMPAAFTNPVNTGAIADQAQGFTAGVGYGGEVTTGDLLPWAEWGVHTWDFNFRVQARNPGCN